MKQTLYLCGAGNPEGVRLARRVNEAGERWERLVILDDDPALHGRTFLGVEIEGPFALLAQADPASAEVVSLVARTTDRRVAANEKIASFGIPFATLVHPGVDSYGADVACGVLVYENAIISPNSVVGEHSVVFMGATVGHDARVDEFCVVAAGAVLNARVHLEPRVYVGTNASVLPEITVGRGATIGANSSVIQDVPADATAVGVPAQVLVTGAEPRAPMDRDELERAILEIWQDVLDLRAVGVEENFFDLGGTSQQALIVLSQIRVASGRDIPVTDMFRFPTVAALAANLNEQGGAPHAVAPRGSPYAAGVAAPAKEQAPTSTAEIEGAICRVWTELLDVVEVGPGDDFFELGGTSQLALTAREQIRRATGCQVAPTDIFKFPTGRALAERIQQRTRSRSATVR